MRGPTIAVLLMASCLAAPARASLPYNLSTMLDSALQSNNETDIVTIAKYIRMVAPNDVAEVDDRITAWRDQRTKAQKQAVIEAGPLQLWKGRADIGGFITTGNTDSLGLTAGVDVKREGLDWRHRIRARVDYQRDNGVATREAYLAS